MSSQSDHENKEPPRTGHVYDGIEELDHGIPAWFQVLFYSTIIFGVGYFLYYGIGNGPTLTAEFEKNQLELEYSIYQQGLANPGSAKKVQTESELVALVADASIRKGGHQAYASKCASCHGAEGGGGIGPNLTDDYWIHGAKMTDLVKVISEGVADKGMPAWGQVLADSEVTALAVHVRSLLGTKPAGAKAPQGERMAKQ